MNTLTDALFTVLPHTGDMIGRFVAIIFIALLVVGLVCIVLFIIKRPKNDDEPRKAKQPTPTAGKHVRASSQQPRRLNTSENEKNFLSDDSKRNRRR